MADTTISSSGTIRKIDDDASEILEQRHASERYFMNNYYSEWTEVYRNLECRVEPITKKNDQGEDEEDTSRSNVALPDTATMVRRGTARLTRNSPNLRLRGANQDNADKAAVQLMYQWDRSESQKSFRKVVRCGKAFGWAVGKSYYDKVEVTRKFKRVTERLTRPELMLLRGAGAKDIRQANKDLGPRLSEAEISQAISEYGDRVTVPTAVTKYNGPMLDYVFIGDFFPEPGFHSIAESAYLIENSIRDEQWLEYWTKQTSEDPDTGEEAPVIDPKKAQELMDMAGERYYLDQKAISLRRMMREAVSIADPLSAGKPIRPPKKRFMVDERHSIVNGRLLIEYVGEENVYLGRQWYPWDTYGKPVYTEMILIPDVFEGIGDSTPRLGRFLQQLRNGRMNQTTDFINNKLLPLLKTLKNTNLAEYDVVRTGFARLLRLKNLNEVEFLQDPQFPVEAFQDQAQFVRELQQIEPAMTDFAPGTDTIPQAGKLATSLVMQKQAADVVLADELNNLGQFVRDTMEVWIAFNQQAMEDALEIPADQLRPGVFEEDRIEALSIRTAGAQARMIRIDPMDIQEEFEILPEEGSTLADDDTYRVQKAVQAFQMAATNPDVFNKRAFAPPLLSVLAPNVPEDQAINPPTPPAPPVKIGFNVTAKFEELAPDVQTAILQGVGLPTQGQEVLQGVKHVSKAIQDVGAAANAAAELEQPSHPTQPAGAGRGANGTPKPRSNGRAS